MTPPQTDANKPRLCTEKFLIPAASTHGNLREGGRAMDRDAADETLLVQ